MSEKEAQAFVGSVKQATDLHRIHFEGAVQAFVTGNPNGAIREAQGAYSAVMQIFRNAYELGKLVGNDEELEEYARKLAREMINE